MANKVLVVDDESSILESCRTILEDQGYEVETVGDGDAAIESVRGEFFDLALIDLKMPGRDGLETLELARGIDPDLTAIIFTAYGTIESAVEALKKGAFNYITKPFTAEQLLVAVEKGLEHSHLQRENLRLQEELKDRGRFENIIGASPALERILATLSKVAPSNANVLITGESGTGKEVIARTLHAHSRRAKGPFVPVDCAALPANLLESELFGHEKGAFTGADRAKRGLLEQANEGTLFLDEIGELSTELQAKLLRTLQERSFRRLGGEKLIHVDIRIVSSTNRNLEEEVTQGRFRQDLFYRLNVVQMNLPPLRERNGDVALLAHHFTHHFARKAERAVPKISAEALQLLEGYAWPGNVREIQNVMERAIVFCDGEILSPADLPESIRTPDVNAAAHNHAVGYRAAREQWIETKGKEYLTGLLRKNGGNISAAAREAQVSRKHIYELLRRFNLKPESL